jgi:hypothetical protein
MAVEHVDSSMSRLDRVKEVTALKKGKGKTQGGCASTPLSQSMEIWEMHSVIFGGRLNKVQNRSKRRISNAHLQNEDDCV